MIRAAVLTVSDTCSRGTATDRSGPAVAARLESAGHLVATRAVVPDERAQISVQLRTWADSGEVDAVFTTGGTGVALRDITPEATLDVIERQVPGLSEQMRAEGLKQTPRAVLSRGVAGIRGRTLIVNLPGSPKGAVESLDVILNLVPHIIDLLQGRTSHEEGAKRS